MVKILAVIPARAGSKGVKGKNIRIIGGKPLVAHSILSAKESKLVDDIIVTTDSSKIKSIAKKYGALTPFDRPSRVSGDNATDYETIRHTLEEFKRAYNYYPEIIVHLRPTSPYRPKGIVDSCINLLKDSTADSLRCVTECTGGVTPYKMWSINNKKYLKPILTLPGNKEPFNTPRQLLPKAYLQIGVLDVIKINTILNKKSMTGDKILSHIVDNEYALDIDDYNDLKIMRAKFKTINHE